MSQKRDMEGMDGRLQEIEELLNVIKSRLSSMEERLMELERVKFNRSPKEMGEDGG